MKILVLAFLLCVIHSNGQPAFSLYFTTNSYAPQNKELNKIDTFIRLTEPIDSICIVAHCDSRGSESYNLLLSEKRGIAVAEFIKAKVNTINTIHIKPMGESEAHEYNENSNKDRRADVYIFQRKNSKTEEKETKSNLDSQIEKSSIGDRLVLKNIQFYGGSDIPLPEATAALEDLLQTMNNNPTLTIAIEGHICCSMDDSEKLSLRRAKAVYDYLIMNGIDSNRLQYQGFGRTKPITEERTEDERSANRRVEIRIISK